MSISELIYGYNDEIQYLAGCFPNLEEVNGLKVDELYFLRYLLSSKSRKHAENSIKASIVWHKENISEPRNENYEISSLKNYTLIKEYFTFSLHGETAKGDLILILKSGLKGGFNIFEDGSFIPQDLVHFLNEMNDVIYRKLDNSTRRTGNLTKLLVINDCCGLNIKPNGNLRAFFRGYAASTRLYDVIYPQMLLKSVHCSIPRYVLAIWRVVKLLFSADIIKKVCLAGDALQIASNESLQTVIDETRLPRFLGGKCDCNSDLCLASNKKIE